MMNELIHKKYVMIIQGYALNIRAHNYIEQTLTGLKRDRERLQHNNRRDYNTPLSTMDSDRKFI